MAALLPVMHRSRLNNCCAHPLRSLPILVFLGFLLILGSLWSAPVLLSRRSRPPESSRESSTASSPVAAAPSQIQQSDAAPELLALVHLSNLHNAILAAHLDVHVVRAAFLGAFEPYQHHQTAQRHRQQQQWQHGHPVDSDEDIDTDKDVSDVANFAGTLYDLLLATGKVIPCRVDATLPSFPPAEIAGKYFVAANLRNNQNVLPHFVYNIVRYLLHMPHGSTYVSIYESNSHDGTAVWLNLLELVLHIIGVPSQIVARGTMVKPPTQERIEFLAAVRNAAMQPLYQHYRLSELKQGGDLVAPTAGLPFNPNKVIFINDVYLCWQDIMRLQQHDTDIACGTDWEQTMDVKWLLKDEDWNRRRPKPVWPPEISLEGPKPDVPSLEDKMPILFYDMWVSRDINGSRLSWLHPYTQDKVSSEKLTAGLPFRAQCCWNGLVVLNAEPFRRGLRIRTSVDDECRASESTLVCNDFARLGFDRVVVDPSIQLAYSHKLSQEIITKGIGGVNISTWAQATAAGVANMQNKAALQHVECCWLNPGKHFVDFSKDCRLDDIMAVNYTARAVANVK